MNISLYRMLRHSSEHIGVGERYAYIEGECNPAIFARFISMLSAIEKPAVVWEPFAGHTGVDRNGLFSEKNGVKRIAHDIEKTGSVMVRDADSTVTGPGEMVTGVFFHPPYFGSCPFSEDPRDISNERTWDGYMSKIRASIGLISKWTKAGGLVCVVAREYTHNKNRILLPDAFATEFGNAGFGLTSVYRSEPDVVLIFKR